MKHNVLTFPAMAGLALVAAQSTMAQPTMAQQAPAALRTVAVYAPITLAEVETAQKAWGDALVMIAIEYDNNGKAAATRVAEQVLDTAYGYAMGPVLFKPTLAAPPTTFRTTREGALSYFVGGNPNYPSDSGFALKHWRGYKIDNASILITGNSAISMGNVTLTDSKGNVTVVDKTWGYVRDGDGKLRIVLHHSSLPFAAK